ncbi:hypothetical protein [Acidocella sp. KAb 2-4]|uniref:hypothetical protein n=1 Tax=Acidocella sp. KAb 2-4 TaxID=2885158 RepID=UPI001D08954E|nr:hypothetical protein [Acidocella sp. KAb 2-4]MCB5945840.1 hypothetical protein [Acidocella sp. KAb 2-4]
MLRAVTREVKSKMHNSASDTVTMPMLVLRRATAMANGMGLPVTYCLEDDYDYLSVPDTAPQFPEEDDLIPARWSLAMAEDGRWIVGDAGRWNYIEVHVPSSLATHNTLADALTAIREARAAALLADA